MKRRSLFLIGIGFAFVIAWAWLAKPRTLKKELYMAGIQLTPDRSYINTGSTTYYYMSRLNQEATMMDVLARSGFRDVTSTMPLKVGARNFVRASFLDRFTGKEEHVILERKRDYLQVTVWPDIK